jgi:hypothetical protein
MFMGVAVFLEQGMLKQHRAFHVFDQARSSAAIARTTKDLTVGLHQ